MEHGIPIGKLSELTGVAPTTLRAWERRYQLFSPDRSEGGHRLYNFQDVQLVKQLMAQMEQGCSISEAIKRVVHQPVASSEPVVSGPVIWLSWQQKLLQALARFDESGIEAVYQQALSLYPFTLVSQHLLLPVLHQLGDLWQSQPLGILQEHFFTTWLRNKLGARLHHEAQRRHGRLLIIACLPQEVHELGALLFALEALGHGYRVLYLGANTPLTQLNGLALQTQAAALVLAGTVVTPSQLHPSWSALLPMVVPVFVGGPFAAHYADWVVQQGALVLPHSTEQAVLTLFEHVPPYSRG